MLWSSGVRRPGERRDEKARAGYLERERHRKPKQEVDAK